MFKGNIILLKYLKHFSPKANFCIHHILLNVDGSKPFFASDSCDRILCLLAGVPDNPCTLVLRLVGIPDIDWNAFLSHRKDSIFMENAGSHIGKLTQLTIRYDINSLWIFDNAGICNQKA